MDSEMEIGRGRERVKLAAGRIPFRESPFSAPQIAGPGKPGKRNLGREALPSPLCPGIGRSRITTKGGGGRAKRGAAFGERGWAGVGFAADSP